MELIPVVDASDTASESAAGTATPSSVKRSAARAGLACTECNKRKTKCDAKSHGLPCSRCQAAGRSCELVQSRRGKYDRSKMKSNLKGISPQASRRTGEGENRGGAQITQPLAGNGTEAQSVGNVPPVWTTYSEPVGSATIMATDNPSVDIGQLIGSMLDNPNDPARLTTPSDENLGIQAMLPMPQSSFATRSASGCRADSNLLAETTPARESDTTNAWTDLMQLERHDIESTHDAHDVTYASDLFTLSYILRHKWDQRAGATLGLTRREHFPGPAGMNALLRSTSTPANKQDIAEAQYLADMGCFVLPPKHVLDNMISAYFQYFHPNYPIIARATFMHKYVNVLSGSIPLLLLWGMLYVGCTLCSSEDIEHAGFANRFEALRSFAKRGKALYNAKYERDKILVIIFEFLISQVSSDGEDSYMWAARASCSAQSLGMHKSTVSSKIVEEDRQYWRRVWWAVYIRDRHSAAGTGRPYRINDDFVDVEMPQRQDFEGQEEYEVFFASVQLAHLITQIVKCRLASAKDYGLLQQAACYQSLLDWRRDLPVSLSTINTSGNLFAAFLHLSFHCWVIHLFRQSTGSATEPADTVASQSALAATHLFEDLLTKGNVGKVPQFCVTALFAAMSMHLSERLSINATLRELSRHRLAICGLAAKELSQVRPVASWFRTAFQTLDNQTPISDEGPGTSSQKITGDKMITSTAFESAFLEQNASDALLCPNALAEPTAPQSLAVAYPLDTDLDWSFEFSNAMLSDIFDSQPGTSGELDDEAFAWLHETLAA